MNTQLLEKTVQGIEVDKVDTETPNVRAFAELAEQELLLVGGGSGDVGFA